jgi:hypothetical protein
VEGMPDEVVLGEGQWLAGAHRERERERESVGNSNELRKTESERTGVEGMPDEVQLGAGQYWPVGVLLERERERTDSFLRKLSNLLKPTSIFNLFFFSLGASGRRGNNTCVYIYIRTYTRFIYIYKNLYEI